MIPFFFSAIPVTFKQKLKNQEAVEEGSVMLRCELSKPGVPVEWRRDAQLLKEGDKYQMKQEGRVAELMMRNLTLKDTGEYSCFVGTVVTSAQVKVRGKHYFDQFKIKCFRLNLQSLLSHSAAGNISTRDGDFGGQGRRQWCLLLRAFQTWSSGGLEERQSDPQTGVQV